LTLPHSPTIYLPSGKAYEEIENTLIGRELASDYWEIDSWKVTQAFQRHLLQVGFVDRFIGSLIQKMKQEGLYDKALLIVTADHGISFLPGDRARAFTQFNHSDISGVPLFVKLPHQKEGGVRDQAIETVDIIPTIAAALDIDIPWKLDGKSPFKSKRKDRKEESAIRSINSKKVSTIEALRFPRDPQRKYKTLKKKYLLFGSGSEDLLYKIGPRSDLLGIKAQDALENKWIMKTPIQLDKPGTIVRVNPKINFIPSWVTGRVLDFPKENHTSPQWLAITVNGIIRATTQTSFIENPDQFSVLLPEASFQKGDNYISVFKIPQTIIRTPNSKNEDRHRNNNFKLGSNAYIWNKLQDQYRLFQSRDESSLMVDRNGDIHGIPAKKAGWIESVKYSPEALYFIGRTRGWKSQTNSIRFLIFNDQNLVYTDYLIKPQVSENNQSENSQDLIQMVFRVPVYQNKKVKLNSIRIFLTDEKGSFQEVGISPRALSSSQEDIHRHYFYGALSYCQESDLPTKAKETLKNSLKEARLTAPGKVTQVELDNRQKLFRLKVVVAGTKMIDYPEKALILINGKTVASSQVGPGSTGKQTDQHRLTKSIDFKIDVSFDQFENLASDQVQVFFSYKNKKRMELEYSKFFPWTNNPCF
jgi:hypothetical protein